MRIPAVPLAWQNLAHDRVRFALFAAGIGFAVVLMGVQYGIMNAMLDSNTVLIQRLKGDLVLLNPNKASLLFREAITQRRLEQAKGVPGVRSVSPLYLEYSTATLRHTATDPRERTNTRRIRVIGVPPDADILDLPTITRDDWHTLNTPGTALYDTKSRPHPDQVNHRGQSVFGKLEPGAHT